MDAQYLNGAGMEECGGVGAAACPDSLDGLVAQLKDEYVELRFGVGELEAAVREADRCKMTREAAQCLRDLRERLTPLLERLNRHAQCEEEHLVPLLDGYFHRGHMPTMRQSIWVMEKEQELALDYLQAFVRGVDALGEIPGAARLAELIRCLEQGCRLLKGHLQMEGQTIFPLAEEILTDLDLLFS